MKNIRSLIIYLFVPMLASCSSVSTIKRPVSGAGRGRMPLIRVLLASSTKSLMIKSKNGFSVLSEGGEKLCKAKGGERLICGSSGGKIVISLEPSGRVIEAGNPVSIEPNRASGLIYGGIAYGGGFIISKAAGRRLDLVNTLPLEEYLYGVVPNELGVRGPDEFAALEAQSVAARTYALSRMAYRRSDIFDVHAGVRDQVYMGLKKTGKLAKAAVRKTRGKVLEYRGDLARTYYSANCGGHTSDIALMWPAREPAPYLSGVLDRARGRKNAFCIGGRHFRWRYSYSAGELGRLLRKTIPSVLHVPKHQVGRVRDLRIAARSSSGRVEALEIITTKRSFNVVGDRIRWILLVDYDKGHILPSAMFSLNKIMNGGRLSFVSITGGGNGHGVGMCQSGALEMARLGYTFEMILNHYYPGCRISKRY